MIIFDLDGTLADCEHRRHLVDPFKNPDYEFSSVGYDPITRDRIMDAKPRWHRKDRIDVQFKPDWRAFYDACDKDEPIYPTIEILKVLLHCEASIQIWSGRCESVREKTVKWLYEHISYCDLAFTPLKMRLIGDNTPNEQLKERWLDEYLSLPIMDVANCPSANKIEFVLDSQPDSIAMWRRRGIFVFDCNQKPGEF